MTLVRTYTLNCDERLLDRVAGLTALAAVSGEQPPIYCLTWFGEEQSLPELRRLALSSGWARENGLDLCAAHKSRPEAACDNCGARMKPDPYSPYMGICMADGTHYSVLKEPARETD